MAHWQPATSKGTLGPDHCIAHPLISSGCKDTMQCPPGAIAPACVFLTGKLGQILPAQKCFSGTFMKPKCSHNCESPSQNIKRSYCAWGGGGAQFIQPACVGMPNRRQLTLCKECKTFSAYCGLPSLCTLQKWSKLEGDSSPLASLNFLGDDCFYFLT